MAQATILIVDPIEQRVGFEIQTLLRGVRDYTVNLLEGPLPDLQNLDPTPDLIILIAPPSDRTERLRARLETLGAAVPLLLVIGAAHMARGLDELIACRRTDFLVTPIREIEVFARVERLLSRREEQDRIRGGPATEAGGLARLVGEAPAFLAVKRRIALLARCDAPVLITGETGTGKELCASALHQLSWRAGKPFLAINCGAVPVQLFESELFGHEKGAFTSASSVQAGLVAQAEGGTLFLDEIEALSMEAQVKLVRFSEDLTYHPLGGPRSRCSDVRIVAATNVALKDKIRAGAFREDLFYRLAVLTLSLPSLRERRGDIPLLAVHFLTTFASHTGENAKQLSPRAMEILSQYSWPGNVRELKNAILQAVVLTDAQTIEADDLRILVPCLLRQPPRGAMKRARAQVLEEFERAYVAELLAAHRGNVTQAAREAQRERRSFGRLVKKYQLAKH